MHTCRICILACATVATLACTGGRQQASGPLAGYRIVDLTHPFDDTTVFWPTGQPFRHEQTAWGPQPDGYWYSSYDLAMSEHCGTHLDAPIHFAEGRPAIGDLSLEDLSGPLAVVDVEQQCAADPDYAATPADLDAHEDRHGRVPAGAIVLFRTGWSRRWPDTLQYLGDDTPGKADALHFPGISAEAARWLVEREIAATGIDTASIDPGQSRNFAAHQVLAAEAIPILENVASLEGLPARGAHLLAFPMKIGRGSGAPCRVAALVPAAK